MELLEIRNLLELSALRILRGPNAAMVLGFLHRAFKRHLRVAIPESELHAALGTYLEPLREQESPGSSLSAAAYLAQWVDANHGFLRKYYGEEREPLYEL